MTTSTVRVATIEEQADVESVILLAFSTDPMTRWSLGRAERYLAVMPQLVGAFGGRAFAAGTAHVVEGFGGAALWLPPGVEADGERLGAIMQEHAVRSILPDVMRVFEEMDRFHPQGPVWYLPLIGVDPTAQGQGNGSALLEYALARSDEDSLPAYLESSNPRNITLYQRHGFEILGTIQVGSSPRLVPMLRQPRPAQHAR
jgi:ribosomal protein S18 acetylase RimI-like enzyme